MSPIDYSQFAFPKGQPKVLAKADTRREAEKALRDAYKAVDARDKKTCRATGRPLVAGAVDPRMRLERHHIQKRSTDKRLIDDPVNIVTVAGDVHQLLEAHALEIEGVNADKRLVFRWNRAMVAAGKEPFKLLSKRKSQRRRRHSLHEETGTISE
jgi:hypothetical protein